MNKPLSISRWRMYRARERARQIRNAVRSVRRKYGVRDRTFTARDFYRICRGEDIGVIHSPYQYTFIMTMPTGERFIILPRRKRRQERLHAMYHELGHHFCNHRGLDPRQAFDGDEIDEAEAEVFVELAIGKKFF